MGVFSVQSERLLLTCDDRLESILRDAIQHYDFEIVADEEPDKYPRRRARTAIRCFPTGPNGKPCYNDAAAFGTLANVLTNAARRIGVRLAWTRPSLFKIVAPRKKS